MGHNRIVIGVERNVDRRVRRDVEDVGCVERDVLSVGTQIRNIEAVLQLLVGVAVRPGSGSQPLRLNHSDRNRLLRHQFAVLEALQREALYLAVIAVQAVACLRNAGKVLHKEAGHTLVLRKSAGERLAGVGRKKRVNLGKKGHLERKKERKFRLGGLC